MYFEKDFKHKKKAEIIKLVAHDQAPLVSPL